jgi:hypothetical protein
MAKSCMLAPVGISKKNLARPEARLRGCPRLYLEINDAR